MYLFISAGFYYPLWTTHIGWYIACTQIVSEENVMLVSPLEELFFRWTKKAHTKHNISLIRQQSSADIKCGIVRRPGQRRTGFSRVHWRTCIYFPPKRRSSSFFFMKIDPYLILKLNGARWGHRKHYTHRCYAIIISRIASLAVLVCCLQRPQNTPPQDNVSYGRRGNVP